MDQNNNFGRLLLLLLSTTFICIILYGLPGTLWGVSVKKVDILSDIRIRQSDHALDSLLHELSVEDTLTVDSAAIIDSLYRKRGLDSLTLVLRDSLYGVMYAVQGADSLGKYIEDYSIGHTGLKRFYEALRKRQTMNRPVRIAFMGDSFIEGDIIVADFRESMQLLFGGGGVGFVPIHSVAAQFRPTINQKQEGWEMLSLMSSKNYPYTLPGLLFRTNRDEATLSLRTVDRYPSLKRANTLKFIYEQNEGTVMHLSYNNSEDTIRVPLPSSQKISQYVLKDTVTQAHLHFRNAENFRALGVVLEDSTGVVVDNFSLRGNSGLLLEHFDPDYCAPFNEIRPYDLIILQYGLNMVSEDMLQYGWYRKRMVDVVNHMKVCFPDSDILLLGVSDRGRVQDGEFETMPAVLAMLHAQRQTAKLAGIPFWNTFGAMGGANSMVRYVENNWASKDYTHLSFRGGRELAKKLFEALMLEKEFYDEAEKAIQ